MHKFQFILDDITNVHKNRKFAIIIDEAAIPVTMAASLLK